MSATIDTLLTIISKQITIYLGIPVLIAGITGGILNIIVFLSLKTFRQNACAFFLTIMSFVNIGQLLTGMLSRIMISGFNMDWTETSSSYCKFRFYCLQVCGLTSYTCMCLATIDQFMATSLRPQWQQYFNIKRAHSLCMLFFILWLFHGVPTLIWYSPVVSPITNSISCSITNAIYRKYSAYCYTLILVGIVPIIITVSFGCLAYRNVRQIPYRTVPLVRRELDKQLTSIVLVQVVHNFLIIVPYISVLIVTYSVNLNTESPNYTGIIFLNRVTGLIYYLYFAIPFYIYVVVSKRFRQQLLYVLTGGNRKGQQQPAAIGLRPNSTTNAIGHEYRISSRKKMIPFYMTLLTILCLCCVV